MKTALHPGWKMTTPQYYSYWRFVKQVWEASTTKETMPEVRARIHIAAFGRNISAKAKTIAPKVAKIIQGVKTVEAVREPKAVEVLAQLYSGIKQVQRQRRRERQSPKEKQETLL